MTTRVLLLSLFIVLIMACDKIKDPLIQQNGAVGKNFTTKTNKTVNGYYKILLEDYTGHTCGNCPKAALQADTLSGTYGVKLVVMAVHAGHFALPQKGYPDDFQTAAGTTWDGTSYFGISYIGNPNGMVNRKAYPGVGLIEAYTQWSSTILNTLAAATMTVKLLVTTNYDPSVRALNTDIAAEFQNDYPNDVKLCVALTEDGIIGPQTNYLKSPDRDSTYVFNHVLRGTVNGQWGEVLKTGPSAAGDSAWVSTKNFKVDPKFNDSNVSVVVFAYDAKTLEVLQVEKVKIR